MTAGDLHDALARLGADLMPRALAALERGALTLTPQPEAGVTYAAKIAKDETRIDWAKPCAPGARPHPRPVAVSRRLVRARRRARQGAALDARARAAARPARVLDDRLTDCLRRRRGAAHAGAARRQAADEAEEFLRGTPVKPARQVA